MNTTTVIPGIERPARPGSRLSSSTSFLLLASVTITFLAGASAPTALYAQYQAQWGFSSLMVTVIFGVYALAVLAALLVLGRLSDHVGRRPVLLVTVAAQLVTMWLFATADGLATLLVARTLQGLAAGAAIAAVGAGLLDLDKSRGALTNAIITPTGTAVGGVIGGLFVSLLPAPGMLVFVVLGTLMLLQGIALLWMRETTQPRRGAVASLRPRFSLAAQTRGPLLHAAPVIIAGWAVAGFFTALGPAFVKNMMGENSALLSGVALFFMAGSAGAAALLLRNQTPRDAMHTGGIALATGMVLVMAAVYLHLPLAFFAGLAASGVGFGSGFQGAVRSVVSQANADERAGVLAVIFVIAYLAFGLPAIGAGYLLAQGSQLSGVATEFGSAIMLLSLLPLLLPIGRAPAPASAG